MSRQLEPPPRGVNIFSAHWRDWLFNLYRCVVDLTMVFRTQEIFSGTPSVGIIGSVEGVNSPYTVQATGGAATTFTIQMAISGSLDGINYDVAVLLTVTDASPVESLEIEIQYTHLQFEILAVASTGPTPTFLVNLGGF